MTDTTSTADTIETGADTIEPTEIPMRILKVASTASLSNRSTLGYAIGCDVEPGWAELVESLRHPY